MNGDAVRLRGGAAGLKAAAEAVLERAEGDVGLEPMAEVREFVSFVVEVATGWRRAAEVGARHAQQVVDAAELWGAVTSAGLDRFGGDTNTGD